MNCVGVERRQEDLANKNKQIIFFSKNINIVVMVLINTCVPPMSLFKNEMSVTIHIE